MRDSLMGKEDKTCQATSITSGPVPLAPRARIWNSYGSYLHEDIQ